MVFLVTWICKCWCLNIDTYKYIYFHGRIGLLISQVLRKCTSELLVRYIFHEEETSHFCLSYLPIWYGRNMDKSCIVREWALIPYSHQQKSLKWQRSCEECTPASSSWGISFINRRIHTCSLEAVLHRSAWFEDEFYYSIHILFYWILVVQVCGLFDFFKFWRFLHWFTQVCGCLKFSKLWRSLPVWYGGNMHKSFKPGNMGVCNIRPFCSDSSNACH